MWSRRWIRLALLVLLMLSSSAAPEQPIPAVTAQATSAVYLPLLVQQQLPTAQELIAAALKAGRIDYGTSLLYHEERQPQQFWGAGSSGEDERLFYEAIEPLGPIPADVAAQPQPFLMRPDDPQSISAPRPSATKVDSQIGGAATVMWSFSPVDAAP